MHVYYWTITTICEILTKLFYFVFLGAISTTGYFTNNIWPFHIIDINCTGEEDNIFDCTHNEIENYMCLWSHDASIVCHGQYNPIGIMKCAYTFA